MKEKKFKLNPNFIIPKKKKWEIWLNLGSGVGLAEGFINVDNFFTLEDLKEGVRTKKGAFKNARITKDTEFVKADICNMPFPDNYADYIECNDVIEHQPINNVHKFLKEIYRVLKPGCKVGLSTTNFDELARLWTLNITGNKMERQQDWDRLSTLQQIIYGNQAGPGEFHTVPFNPFLLGFYFQRSGFDLKNITINVYPTGTPYLAPQRAYDHVRTDWENVVVKTEQLWVEAIK